MTFGEQVMEHLQSNEKLRVTASNGAKHVDFKELFKERDGRVKDFDGTNGYYKLEYRFPDALFSFSRFPGCCGVAILHDMHFSNENARVQKIVNELCRAERARLCLYTHRVDDSLANFLLENDGWKIDHAFSNIKTSRDLLLISKEFKDS